MSLDDKELATALLLERQMLQERFLLTCGCEVESKYGHPTQRGWRLVNEYQRVCVFHEKIRDSLAREKKREWPRIFSKFALVPKWRDANGLWIEKEEWDRLTVPLPENGVFEYKGASYLLLLGYLGTPVILGEEKGEKMAGRAITLNLSTGKTFPAPVPEELLRHFGWTKLEG